MGAKWQCGATWGASCCLALNFQDHIAAVCLPSGVGRISNECFIVVSISRHAQTLGIATIMVANEATSDHWEALERALNETEVLAAIYGGREDDEASSSFAIVAPDPDELDRAKATLEMILNGDDTEKNTSIPNVRIEIRTEMDRELGSNVDDDCSDDIDPGNDERIGIVMRCLLPKGYPETAAAVMTSVETSLLTRSSREELTRSLNERAICLLGTEAVMDLVEEAKVLCRSKHQEEQARRRTNNNKACSSHQEPSGFGRRWIWVHHITKKDRIQSILAEAQSANLRGMLKHGYPGIVLVEGTATDCETFVKWIKADKSQEGGFGRNWGHHVRGEIFLEEKTDCRLPSSPIMRATDDLAVLAG